MFFLFAEFQIKQFCLEETLDSEKRENEPYEVEDDGKGHVSECLKKKLQKGVIKNKQCIKVSLYAIFPNSKKLVHKWNEDFFFLKIKLL